MKSTMGILTAAMLTLTVPALAENKPTESSTFGSVELSAGHLSSTLDAKLSVPLFSRAGFFGRNRTTLDYQGDVSFFQVNSLTYNLIGGLDVEAEVDVAPKLVDPRLGLQYFTRLDDFNLFLLASISARSEDLTIIGNLTYNPKITENVRLVSGVEGVTVSDKGSHQFSTQRLRLGAQYAGYEGGLSLDLTESGRNLTFNYNAGFFVKRSF